MTFRTYTCPTCNARSAEPAVLCDACGAPLTAFDPPDDAAGLRGPGADADRGSASDALPPIQVEVGDHERLEQLARRSLDTEPATARFLLSELNRATVGGELPDGVATPNARILFKLDGQNRIESRTLVYPEHYMPTGQYLTILSPLGVALLGLKAGDRMPFLDRQGDRRGVMVARIAYRPGASRVRSGARAAF